LSGERATLRIALILIVVSSFGWAVPRCAAQQRKKIFTLTDEIGLAHFGDPYTGYAEAVLFSPDGNCVAVHSERGSLEANRVEDSLRFYRTSDIVAFLKRSDRSASPPPIWVVDRSSNEGPIINKWRWLSDSSGVAFLERTESGDKRLVLADLRKKIVKPLTSALHAIEAFDILDRQHFVYTLPEPAEPQESQTRRPGTAIVGTGRSIEQLLLPDDARTIHYYSHRRYYLWAVVKGQPFEVKNDGQPITADGSLALAPDGRSVVAKVPVSDIPASWETLYPPPPTTSLSHIRAAHQDVRSGNLVHEYVRINLQTGVVQALTDAPVSSDGGLWAGALGGPNWSSDGQAILLPGTFLRSNDFLPSRPCIAVIDLQSSSASCVEMLKGLTKTGVEEGYHLIKGIRFVDGDRQRVVVSSYNHQDLSVESTEYEHVADGSWHVVAYSKGQPEGRHTGLEVTVMQNFDRPPVLVATNQKASRVMFDPNSRLSSVELGETSVYSWKDKEGRDWRGGLYEPVNYTVGQRYPLVIQTHGFIESEFEPSGIFPTAFAARLLAAAGMVVLQVGEHCPLVTPEEGLCAVSGYESAVHKLVSEGLVDADRIGIIGFSRTCFYVMATLSTGSLHVKAASITDGFLLDYFQYMTSDPGSEIVKEADLMIGAKPFGEGLHQWQNQSPVFKLTDVRAPLLVVGMGPSGVLEMWEPYAGLRHLKKPVDLIMLNTDEHVLTNPAARMASQGGSVDWFRFWLMSEEDPDPVKAGQYTRWRELRKLQEKNAKGE
jgi:dipeptidyl aminopeptidase/acylaminoacyl peptidase